jgi:RNA polymerase sigma factor (sigma-70 family)
MKTVLRHLRRAALLHESANLTDSQLLDTFLSRREGAAFEALLHRHGPLVLGVCRRVLHNACDAEDAFQATFLVLVRKAGTLRSRELLANWLYGVAYRTAMKARAMNARQRASERQAGPRPRPQASTDEAHEELLAQLDHELSRLPDKYRAAVILCELQGKSRKEAAGLLGVPEGTLSWRLAQARKLLAKRLGRHRAALSIGTLAAVRGRDTVSAPLLTSTTQAALTAGTVPARILTLTEGVMKAMLLSKLKITVCFGVLMLLTGIGASGLSYRATAQQPGQPRQPGQNAPLPAARAESRPQADDLEALRLEIEALRRSLQATRERVKTLENEVSALKGRGGAEAARDRAPLGGDRPGATMRDMAPGTRPAPADTDRLPRRADTGRLDERSLRATTDALAAAEATLKKLQQDTSDRQTIEALERAIQTLKERNRPRLDREPAPAKTPGRGQPTDRPADRRPGA